MHLKFSQDIDLLLKRSTKKSLTLGQILAETSERGFSLSISLLVLPFLFPMPPGISSFLGFACFLFAGQMVIGRHSPWLPKKIAQLKFPRSFSIQFLHNLRRVAGVLEKIVRPRWLGIAENKYIWRINGICIAWLAILLMLPIPMTNPLPAIGILVLAVATLETDGLLICLGYGLTLVNTFFFAFIGYALWQAPNLLPNLFR